MRAPSTTAPVANTGFLRRLFFGLGIAVAVGAAAPSDAQRLPDIADGSSALAQAVTHSNRIETLEAQIAELESEFGPFDERLLPLLDNLAHIVSEAQDYPRARELLDQQLQIHRINQGLYSAAQLPIVKSLLQLHSEARDWPKLNDTLSYLGWLYQRDNTLDAETRLQELQELGSWHLRSLAYDVREREAFHLIELTKIDKRSAQIAAEHYGATSTAMAPFLYQQALSDLYIALAIMLTSDTGQDLMLLTEGIRERPLLGSSLSNINLRSAADVEAVYGSRTNTVIERSFKNNMNANISKLERIKGLYSSAGEHEAEAMALLYLGDSTLMRQQFETRSGNFAGIRRGSPSAGSAMIHYADALKKLAESGSTPEEIAAYTRCPVLLPLSEFHARLQDAIEPCLQDENSGVIDLGEFNLVTSLLPGVEGDLQKSENDITAIVQFKVRTNGQASHQELIEISPDDTPSRVKVRKLMDILQFRPAIVDGSAVRTDKLQLLVHIPGND